MIDNVELARRINEAAQAAAVNLDRGRAPGDVTVVLVAPDGSCTATIEGAKGA